MHWRMSPILAAFRGQSMTRCRRTPTVVEPVGGSADEVVNRTRVPNGQGRCGVRVPGRKISTVAVRSRRNQGRNPAGLARGHMPDSGTGLGSRSHRLGTPALK